MFVRTLAQIINTTKYTVVFLLRIELYSVGLTLVLGIIRIFYLKDQMLTSSYKVR
jgi:hypothetical protein